MKIKLWQLEYDFDKEDAKIVVPLILLLLGMTLTQLRKDWMLGGVTAYYILYFFLPPCLLAIKKLFARVRHWFAFTGDFRLNCLFRSCSRQACVPQIDF